VMKGFAKLESRFAGDTWEIERCACKWSSGPGCDGVGNDSLLWGYPVFRDGGNSHHVPIAPAQCCQACLGQRLHPLNECRALNRCSHRGVCVLGSCHCNEGWGGPDCTQPMKQSVWPPVWLTYIAMLVCLILSLAALLGARRILQTFMDRRREAAEEQSALLVCTCLLTQFTGYIACEQAFAHA
jgi:heme exporter protein D